MSPVGGRRLRVRLVQRAADDLAGQRVGQFALVEQHGAIDHDIIDADCVALHLDTAARRYRSRAS